MLLLKIVMLCLTFAVSYSNGFLWWKFIRMYCLISSSQMQPSELGHLLLLVNYEEELLHSGQGARFLDGEDYA
jgi:hypothetical protein